MARFLCGAFIGPLLGRHRTVIGPTPDCYRTDIRKIKYKLKKIVYKR